MVVVVSSCVLAGYPCEEEAFMLQNSFFRGPGQCGPLAGRGCADCSTIHEATVVLRISDEAVAEGRCDDEIFFLLWRGAKKKLSY